MTKKEKVDEEEMDGVLEVANKTSREMLDRYVVRSPYEILSKQKKEEDAITKASKTALNMLERFVVKSPYQILAEKKGLPPNKGPETKEVPINTKTSAANTQTIQLKPLIVELNADGSVRGEEPQYTQVQRIDNSAMISKYPDITEFVNIVYANGLDVLFTEMPNMAGYIGAEILNNGIIDPALSCSIDLTGLFMSPNKKVFLNNVAGVYVSVNLEDTTLLNDFFARKYAGQDISGLDIHSKEETEINKLINLATLPELAGSMNRHKVINTLLKEGFQNSLLDAKQSDPALQLVFSEYKTPNNFKLISLDPNKPMTIAYNGKTATVKPAK